MRKDGIASTNNPLDSRPTLYPDLIEIFQGFLSVGAGRQYNESGPQPVALTEWVSHMNESRIVDLDERREHLLYYRALDQKYLELVHEKIARERSQLMKRQQAGKSKKR